jgi:hypothetical protein
MTDNNKTALAAAIMGGYFLGRTKKAKAAFAVATYLAGRRFGLTPRALLTEGGRRLSDSEQFGEVIEQIRTELLDAGRAAATTLANRRMDMLADSLRGLTEGIAKVKVPGVDKAAGEQQESAGDGERDGAEDSRHRRDREGERPRPKKPPAGKASEHRDRGHERSRAERHGSKKAAKGQPDTSARSTSGR